MHSKVLQLLTNSSVKAKLRFSCVATIGGRVTQGIELGQLIAYHFPGAFEA
jgi:hypothetical protein